jgi:predicted unusual protein kinase regulating ubiquinone biosynthesis (AarF/ABC1/UbiB family)
MICSTVPLTLFIVFGSFLTSAYQNFPSKWSSKSKSHTRLDVATSRIRDVPRGIKIFDENADRLTEFMTDGEYDSSKIDQFYTRRPLLVLERMLEIGAPMIGWFVSNSLFNATAKFRSPESIEIGKNVLASDLREAIVRTKSVTFIKSGQALALRRDLVRSPEIVRELTKLQDEVGTFDNDVAMQIIRDELGEPDELFEFDPVLPIASASIGQVYRARLKENNRLVAVKVQRPDAIETAAIDMFILRKFAAFTKWKFRFRTNLVGIIDVFGSQLFKELDYAQEARNCLQFKEYYGNIPNIYVPFAYQNLTRRRVLTMEFVEGVKGPWKVNGEKMLTIGLQCSVLQLLGTGYFHSDPHRGNLLQTPDGSLCYLDFGMMAQVPANQRYALIGTVYGLINKDLRLVIQNLKTLDFFPPETDEQVVVEALTAAVYNATDGGEGSSLNFTRLSRNIDSVSTLLPFRLPPFYSFIIRTLSILEGLALYVDKDFRLIRGAYPFIAKQIISSPSEEMTTLLRAVLVDENERIRWDKLEEVLSVASTADAAIDGNFDALKQAQYRTDLAKKYAGKDIQGNFTFEVTLQIMDFLLSEKGEFLLNPLVNEIVETIDALGLTALTVSSLITNGLIPRPDEKIDRSRVENFFKLIKSVLKIPEEELPSMAAATNRVLDRSRAISGGGGGGGGGGGQNEIRTRGLPLRQNQDAGKPPSSGLALRSQVPQPQLSKRRENNLLRLGILRSMFEYVTDLFRQLQPERLQQLQPLVAKSSPLVRDIVGRLVERNARRVVRSVASPIIEAGVPIVGRALDIISRPEPRKDKNVR